MRQHDPTRSNRALRNRLRVRPVGWIAALALATAFALPEPTAHAARPITRAAAETRIREVRSFLTEHPAIESLRAESARVVEELDSLQRAVAKPFPIHFLIRRVDPDQ